MMRVSRDLNTELLTGMDGAGWRAQEHISWTTHVRYLKDQVRECTEDSGCIKGGTLRLELPGRKPKGRTKRTFIG